VINLSFLKRSAELRKIVANTGWLFADKILRMGVGLFVSVWVARYLGVEQFGTLNFAMAFVALFSTLSTLGLPGLVIRSLTHEPEKRNEILGTTFWLQLWGGMAGLGLSVATILIFRREDPLTVSLVAILGSVGIFQAFDTIDLWFQSQVQSRYTVVAKNTAFLIFAVVKVGLINLGAPLIAFAMATVAEVAVGALGLILGYKSQGHSLLKWRWNLALAKNLLKESWPLLLSGLTIVIYMRIDQIMLGQMVGSESVGLYAAASKISEMWYFIPMSLAASVAPSIYAAKKIGEGLYFQRLRKLITTLTLVSIVFAVPIALLSRPIILVIFGPEFALSAPILSVHIWASLFVFMGVAIGPWFIAEGLTKLSFRRTLMGALINVVLNLVFIPMYGGVGAAVATVISQAVASFLSNATHPKAREIFNLQLSCLSPLAWISLFR
jgi:PST family polysaccharide transporter